MSNDAISRVNYFDGEALLTADFQDEQNYHVRMRELLCQGLYTPGVVCGLDVKWQLGEQQVTVSPGRALDCEGRLIALMDYVAYVPTLQDGNENYLTISYRSMLGNLVSEVYGEGAKRLIERPHVACKPEFDPDGPDVLLAVISAQNARIKSIYYYFGLYARRHAGAVLGEVQFELGSDPSVSLDPYIQGMPQQRMAISAQKDIDSDAHYLAIEAPEIRFQGNVLAEGDFKGRFDGELSGHADLHGTFNGQFSGDGSSLTGVRATGYWQQSKGAEQSLYYMGGNVGINESAPDAVLSVGQPIHSRIGEGLVTVTAMEKGVATLQGYQTNFTSDLVGKILQFGVVLKQQAVIASVDGEQRLTLKEPFPLGLGPTQYRYVRASEGADDEIAGEGFITPDGTIVTTSPNVQFESQAKLKAGDVLVIDRFVPEQKLIESKKASADSDTAMKLTNAFSEDVTDSAYMFSTEPGRWKTGVGTITSADTTVTGVGTNFMQLPANATIRALRALDVASVPQTWRVDEVTDATHLKMRKISIDHGASLLPMMSSFVQTSWPLMKVGGGAEPTIPPALTIVQNNGSVPNTAAINVDTVKIDSDYALQVNGPTKFQGGRLEIDGELDVDGDLHVTGLATVGMDLSAAGSLNVTGKGTVGGLLTASDDLQVGGKLRVVKTSNFEGAMTAVDVTTTGTATFSKAVEVTPNATFNAHCPATFDATASPSVTATTLKVNNSATVDTLTVNKAAEVDGDLTLAGKLIVKNSPLQVEGNMDVKQNITVDGDLLVPNGTTTVKNLTVTGALNAPLPTASFCFHKSSLLDSPCVVPAYPRDGWPTNSDVYSGTASEVGILMVYAAPQSFSVSNGNWFLVDFQIYVGDDAGPIIVTASEYGGAKTVANASVPVNKGDKIVVKYSGGGKSNKPFNVYLWLFSLQAGS